MAAPTAGVRLSGRAEAFWSGFFGVGVGALREPGVTVVPHARLAGYSGVWFWEHGRSVVVSAPAEWVGALRGEASALLPALAREPEALRALFGDRLGEVIGPAWHGVLDPARFAPLRRDLVRPLTAADAAAARALREACEAREWEHAGLERGGSGRVGAFSAGELVSLAALRPWSEDARGPGVITHPAHRGRGYGGAAVSAAVEGALAEGHLVVYQTLLANQPALALARRLGFAQYASHLAVRLR